MVTAPNQMIAEIWCGALREAGISAVIDFTDTMSFLGLSNRPVRLLVPVDQLAAASELLEEDPDSAIDYEDEGSPEG